MIHITQESIEMKTLSRLQNWAPRIMLAVGLLALTPLVAQAQNSFDPYTSNAVIDSAPLAPAEFGGAGTFVFEAGNNGDTPLNYDPNATPANLMGLEISLGNGVPDVVDPSISAQALTALSGGLLLYFDFTYNSVNRTYTGVQKATIPGSSSFEAEIQYRVTENTFIGRPFNGANVNVQPPAYASGTSTTNDQASSYTYVEAFDFGDAPISGTAPDGISAINYGSAASAIDLSQDSSGFYNQYMYLGSSVDPEHANQASVAADGDDVSAAYGLNFQGSGQNFQGDESGVSFPTLIPGETVTISVVVTIVDQDQSSLGLLNAWIDWNGDGDWADAGERIANTVVVTSSGMTNLTVTVPPAAINSVFTYARFRFGQHTADTTSTASYGEVEDYRVFISEPTAITLDEVCIPVKTKTGAVTLVCL